MSDPAGEHGQVDAAIVGGGIAGLALAHLLTRRRPHWRVVVLEREARAGGKMGSLRRGGFLTELGPNGFLSGAPATEALLDALGLEPRPAAAEARRRYLYRGAGLRPLPDTPLAFLTSELLGPLAKGRALLEPWLGQAVDHEESVHAFLARHGGRAVADALAEPLVLGITGGDPKALSLDALFPRLREIEREHGSLLRGMIRVRRGARPGGGGAPAARRLHGFGAHGMQRLVDALAADLGPRLRVATPVDRVALEGERWTLRTGDGGSLRAERLALATPAYAAAELMAPLDGELAADLRAIPYADVRVLGLGFDRFDVPHPLDGFGYLVPSGEGVRSLGVLWSSTLFPGQAPEGKALLRVLAGGVRDPEMIGLSSQAALAAVRGDLHRTLGVAAPPESVADVRWTRALPQYELGHGARVERLHARAARLPRLELTGTAYRGVGVNDAVADAQRVADGWAPA